MKVFVTDSFPFPLPEGHRFPLAKYVLARRRVEASGLFRPEELIIPHSATDEELLRAHTAEYLTRVNEGTLSEAEQRRIGLPWSAELVARSRCPLPAVTWRSFATFATRVVLVDGTSSTCTARRSRSRPRPFSSRSTGARGSSVTSASKRVR